MTMPKKYRLYDMYDCYGTVFESDDLNEVRNMANRWLEETDGECDMIIQKWSEKHHVHVLQEYPIFGEVRKESAKTCR